MDIIADNIANAQTTRPADEAPFYRRYPLLASRAETFGSMLSREMGSKLSAGVTVVAISEDRVTPGESVYDPGHPHADSNGYLRMPNVNVVNEMVNMISASRAYEANVTVINATKAMAAKALEIGR